MGLVGALFVGLVAFVRRRALACIHIYLDAAPSSFPKLVARGILYMHVRIGLMLPLAKNVQFAVPFRVRTVKERTRLSDTTAKSIGSSVRSSLGLDCAEASTAAEHQI